MPSLAKDLVANMLGRVFNVAVGLACTPLYIHFLGIESYGLVGVLITIATLSTVLTSGFSPALKRELSRLPTTPSEIREARDLVRTLEICVWGAAAVIGSALLLAAPFLARHWLTPIALSPNVIALAIMLMAFVLMLQWPVSLYSAGLYGLDLQVQAQAATSLWVALRSVGAIFALWLISPTIEMLLIWQAAATAVSVACMGAYLWRRLPPGTRARFRPDALRRIWRYVIGSGGVEVGEIMADQADKLVLPDLVSLDAYGLYMLAWNIGGRIQLLYGPVLMAIFPHLCRSDGAGDRKALVQTYRAGSRLSAAVIFSTAIFVGLFPRDLLYLWTRNDLYAAQAAPMVSVFAAAVAIYGLLGVPISLQLAVGWTRLAFWGNIFRAAASATLVLLFVPRFGAIGAGFALCASNCLLLAVMLPLTHRRLPLVRLTAWLGRDLAGPGAAAAIVACAWRVAEPVELSPLPKILYLTATLAATAAAALCGTGYGRQIAAACLRSSAGKIPSRFRTAGE